MDFLTLTLELFRNADHFIMYIAQTYGWWVYLVLRSEERRVGKEC